MQNVAGLLLCQAKNSFLYNFLDTCIGSIQYTLFLDLISHMHGILS